MWIYKHAFFRRDEPELLHALKRKTNQHGAPGRIGGGIIGSEGDDIVLDRQMGARYVSYARGFLLVTPSRCRSFYKQHIIPYYFLPF